MVLVDPGDPPVRPGVEQRIAVQFGLGLLLRLFGAGSGFGGLAGRPSSGAAGVGQLSEVDVDLDVAG
jgi:hypothetical protein